MAETIYTKLLNVQTELKAPKNQHNDFGGFYYRSCEDIMEAVKPLLSKHGLLLTVSDSLETFGERYYVKATATVTDTETGEKIETSAYAREAAQKKGMDESQVTGSTSSYARKYCLNGLFCIDDQKDADTCDNRQSGQGQQPQSYSNNRPYQNNRQRTPRKPVMNENGEVCYTGGQYAGKPVKSVTDFGYLKWTVEKSKFSPEIKNAAKEVLSNADQDRSGDINTGEVSDPEFGI